MRSVASSQNVCRSNRFDRQAIMLGELIAFPWRNPGLVTGLKRFGCSQSLGPAARKTGVPMGHKMKVGPW